MTDKDNNNDMVSPPPADDPLPTILQLLPLLLALMTAVSSDTQRAVVAFFEAAVAFGLEAFSLGFLVRSVAL